MPKSDKSDLDGIHVLDDVERRGWPGTRLAMTTGELHPQQETGVAAENLSLVLIANRCALHPLRPWHVRHEGPVDGVKNAVDAELHHAAQQRRVGEEAARGDVEVGAEDVAEAQSLLARPR